jgi:hypothetical protein
MTPKQKALELYEIYILETGNETFAKNCALVAIDFSRQFITGGLSESFDKTMYLFEIKQEIEKL